MMFWESKLHKWGCICAIVVSILMIIDLFPVSFLMIIVSYALGYFFYFCYKKLKEDVLVNYEIMNQYEQEYLDYNEKILEKNNAFIYETEDNITAKVQTPPLSFLDYFRKFKIQAQGHLGQDAFIKLNQMDELLKILSDKIRSTSPTDLMLQERNIDRILKQYLIPALKNYIELPIFLRERAFLENNSTPSSLLNMQLDLIKTELEEIVQLIYQNDLNRLHDHAEFLKQKLEREEFFKFKTDE